MASGSSTGNSGIPWSRLPDLTQSTNTGFGGLTAGGWLQAGGAVVSAIGAFFDADARKNELKSQALSLEHQSAISAINARIAEFDAQQTELAGRDQAAQVAMQYAQAKGAHRASAGARGVVGGVGSSAEVGASIDLAAELDRLTINTDTALAAGQRRMKAVGQRNQGLLARTSATNLRGSASSIYPALAAGGTLLQAGGQFAMSQERRTVR